MESTYTDLELINAEDMALYRRNIIKQEEVKRMRLKVKINNSCIGRLIINDRIQQEMQFAVTATRKVILLNGDLVDCDVVSPVEITFAGGQAVCGAVVLPGDHQPSIDGALLNTGVVKLPSFRLVE